MEMEIEFRLRVSVRFVSGKFASREDIVQAILDDSVIAEYVTANEGEYEIEVEEFEGDG